MSNPNLPPLPTEVESVYVSVDGLSTFREARDCYYTMDQMHAYAEQAVRQALAAQELVGKWEQVPFGNYVGIQWKKDYVATAGDELYLKRYDPLQDPPCSPTSSTGSSQ